MQRMKMRIAAKGHNLDARHDGSFQVPSACCAVSVAQLCNGPQQKGRHSQGGILPKASQDGNLQPWVANRGQVEGLG